MCDSATMEEKDTSSFFGTWFLSQSVTFSTHTVVVPREGNDGEELADLAHS